MGCGRGAHGCGRVPACLLLMAFSACFGDEGSVSEIYGLWEECYSQGAGGGLIV